MILCVRKLLLKITFVTIVVIFIVDVSWAYEYHEHATIGEMSYKAACEKLINAKNKFTENEKNLLNYIACDNYLMLAKTYGQATALAGDHIDSPEKFTSEYVQGANDADSTLKYLLNAKTNSSHFYPEVKTNWEKHHQEALNLANKARDYRDFIEIRNAFKKAFYWNAFADHFLHDAFASGHVGFNRITTKPNTALYYHNQFNKIGRMFRSGAENCWPALGDGYLFKGPSFELGEKYVTSLGWSWDSSGGFIKHNDLNKTNRERLIESSTTSVYTFLNRFITGNNAFEEEITLARSLPVSYSAIPYIKGNGKLKEYNDELCDHSDNFYPTEQFYAPIMSAYYSFGVAYYASGGYSSIVIPEMTFHFPVGTKGTDHFSFRLLAMGDEDSWHVGIGAGMSHQIYYQYPRIWSLDYIYGIDINDLGVWPSMGLELDAEFGDIGLETGLSIAYFIDKETDDPNNGIGLILKLKFKQIGYVSEGGSR